MNKNFALVLISVLTIYAIGSIKSEEKKVSHAEIVTTFDQLNNLKSIIIEASYSKKSLPQKSSEENHSE